MTNEPDLREQLADLQHQQWSGWMEYLFSKCGKPVDQGTTEQLPSDDDLIIPSWAVERWRRQMVTPYAELTDKEQESDRIEADRILTLITREKQKAYTEGASKINEESYKIGEDMGRVAAYEEGVMDMAKAIKSRVEKDFGKCGDILVSALSDGIDQLTQELTKK